MYFSTIFPVAPFAQSQTWLDVCCFPIALALALALLVGERGRFNCDWESKTNVAAQFPFSLDSGALACPCLGAKGCVGGWKDGSRLGVCAPGWSNFNHVLRVCFQMVATSEADSSGSAGVGDTTGTTLSKLRQTLSSGLMSAQETGECLRQIITLMNCDVQWLNHENDK